MLLYLYAITGVYYTRERNPFAFDFSERKKKRILGHRALPGKHIRLIVFHGGWYIYI